MRLSGWSSYPQTKSLERRVSYREIVILTVPLCLAELLWRYEKLLIISLCVNVTTEEGAADEGNKFVLGQGKADYGDGKRRLIDDSRWWQCMDIGGPASPSAPRYGVGRRPEAFLIDPDGPFVAVRIALQELRREVAKAVGQTR
jgi:hypothetical protein